MSSAVNATSQPPLGGSLFERAKHGGFRCSEVNELNCTYKFLVNVFEHGLAPSGLISKIVR